ncbi:hypothetical protein [Maritimibacter fusiformis]|uniref:Phospholipase A2 domain-containing protein n=1 Tax=Maritimibacter fusiformis TaxID=2603819 RepID=A0A5D0RL26_9RHOB|nr:hypothetical protein [Maritimibacter fusiformis]TYB81636.1 hypothetical protein FVF75_07935 [Maritimibacter fusiformis]
MRRFAFALVVLLGTAGPAAAEEFALVHGNWCGYQKRLGPGGADLPPIDTLDAICMRHDLCYASRGVNDCGCDLAMMREISGLNWASGRSSRLARAVFYAIAALPCTDRVGQLRKIEMALSSDM